MNIFSLDSEKYGLNEDELMLADYLKTYHLGKGNLVKSSNLRCFGKGSVIRHTVNSLRKKGVPICSCPKGYYFASTADEIYETVSGLKSRMTNISEACGGLLETYYQLKFDERK